MACVKITAVTRPVDSITNELIRSKTTARNGNYIRGGRCRGGSCKKWATCLVYIKCALTVRAAERLARQVAVFSVVNQTKRALRHIKAADRVIMDCPCASTDVSGVIGTAYPDNGVVVNLTRS